MIYLSLLRCPLLFVFCHQHHQRHVSPGKLLIMQTISMCYLFCS
ncbi:MULTISPECIES: DUF2933 domain-containing protein [Gammaproteobacteria]